MATIDITISEIQVTHCVVSMPTECPGCGADLTAVNALEQLAYSATAYLGHVDPEVPESPWEGDGDSRSGDDDLVTGYRCANRKCRRVVAGEE